MVNHPHTKKTLFLVLLSFLFISSVSAYSSSFNDSVTGMTYPYPATTSCNSSVYCQGINESLWNSTFTDIFDLHLGSGCNGGNYINFTLDRTYYYIYDTRFYTQRSYSSLIPQNVSLYINDNEVYNVQHTNYSASCVGNPTPPSDFYLGGDNEVYVSEGFNTLSIYSPCQTDNGCDGGDTNGRSIRLSEFTATLTDTRNNNPYFNVTPVNSYICILLNDTFPITIDLNWSIVDIEGDTPYYAYLYDLSEQQFYKDYMNKHFFSYMHYDMNPDSLSDGTLYYVDETSYCNFVAGLTYNSSVNSLGTFTGESNDYSVLPVNYKGYGLQLDNTCDGADVYTVKTKWNYKEFHYNTTIIGLGNGENYTIQFLDQELNDVVNFLVKGDGSNLTLSTSDGANYVELYDEAVDYNLTSIELVYYNNGTIRFGGRTKVYYILSNNPSSSSIVSALGNIDYISYVMINFSNLDYAIQTMYAYQGEAQRLDWTTVQPSDITLYGPRVFTYRYYVRDNLHTEYNSKEFSVKIEKKEYCYAGQGQYPVIDTLIGHPIRDFFGYFDLDDEYRNTIYVFFFIMIFLFGMGIYNRTNRLSFFTPVLFSSVICFVISFVLRDNATMVTFIVTGVLSLVVIGIQK